MFVYSQDDKSFHKYLTEYGGTFTKIFMIMIQGWRELKNNTSRRFCVEFREWLCPYFYHKVTDWWQHVPGHWKQRVSWWCQIFHKLIICIKNFSISTRELFFLWILEFPNFLNLVYVLLVGFEPGSFWLIKLRNTFIFLNKFEYLDILRKHYRRFYKILKHLLKNKNVFQFNICMIQHIPYWPFLF